MKQLAPRLLIAAPASGSGKTLFTCGLLRTLIRSGFKPSACKCGPDYIDPMFHRKVVGTQSRNLDLFLSPENDVQRLIAKSAAVGDITIIEGVMGFYDGIALSDEASAWDLCSRTGTPAILIVDARGKGLSLVAEICGCLCFRDPSMIAGIVLNRVSPLLYERLKEPLERETGVKVLGYLPVLDDVHLASRHLGLIMADEVPDLQRQIDLVADALASSLDIDALLDIARSALPVEFETPVLGPACTEEEAPRIAIARDEAFCFYYEDTFELFKELGAQIVEFSPLDDVELPADVNGLYLGGGYPELYAERLSDNASMRACIARAVDDGMPIIAECGGFTYLQSSIEDDAGATWPMVGVLPGEVYKTSRLQRFGYVTLTSKMDNLLLREGESVRAHEFHYWDSSEPGFACQARKPKSGRSWECCITSASMFAGYPHLFLYSEPRLARRFVRACVDYRNGPLSGAST